MSELRAHELVAERFSYGTPRSAAYRCGFETGVRKCLRLSCKPLPYEPGTADADAWFAGRDEGRHRADSARGLTVMSRREFPIRPGDAGKRRKGWYQHPFASPQLPE